MYAGGLFHYVNNLYSPGIAVWDEFASPVTELSAENYLVSPNPFHSQLTLTFPSQNIKQATITLRNTLGQVVYHAEEKDLSPTKTTNTSNLSDVIYLLEVEMDGERTVRKVVKD